MKQKVGRHCRICGKPGGVAVTDALRGLGYLVVRTSSDLHMYAHNACIVRERRKARKEERP